MSYESDEYEYSEQQSDLVARLEQQEAEQFDETAETFRKNMNIEKDQYYYEASFLFETFYKENIVFHKQNVVYKNLDNLAIFKEDNKIFYRYEPFPNLYFLPTILVPKHNEHTIKLRDQITKYYGKQASVLIHNDRPKQILVKIHRPQQLKYYVIKTEQFNQKHRIPILLDEDLSLIPLFKFYSENCSPKFQFNETCGVLLYWAYQRGLLSKDYLSENCLKMLTVFYFFSNGYGLPNIVYTYGKKFQQKFIQIRKKVKINKDNEVYIDPSLMKQSNYSFKHATMYLKRKSKNSTEKQRKVKVPNITPVPFPVQEKQVHEYCTQTKIKDASPKLPQDLSLHAVLNFFSMMNNFHHMIKKQQIIEFDFEKSRKGFEVFPEIKFNIRIIHPIFRTNMCQSLTNDSSKLQILKSQISEVIKIYNQSCNGPLNAILKIFEKKQ